MLLLSKLIKIILNLTITSQWVSHKLDSPIHSILLSNIYYLICHWLHLQSKTITVKLWLRMKININIDLSFVLCIVTNQWFNKNTIISV